MADEEDVNTAVAAARAAFPGWAAKPPVERASILLRFADLLEANGQEIVQLDTLVSGKPKLLGNMSEVDLPVKAIRCTPTPFYHLLSPKVLGLICHKNITLNDFRLCWMG